MGMLNHPPQNFPQSIETKYGVGRDQYDILISALELIVANQSMYGYQQYINSVLNQGFDVRLAVIQTNWNGLPANSTEVTSIHNFAQQRQIPITFVNASNDPNVESSRIRTLLYP
jgi:endo-alpha-1,4-polygalactosaminidase (GH114 family)